MEHALGAFNQIIMATTFKVLILIVMEHALGGTINTQMLLDAVLILIVMEHALGVTSATNQFLSLNDVLILIVMEHALGEWILNALDNGKWGLNPYCNGTCSRSNW